jgi:hypothetical protein
MKNTLTVLGLFFIFVSVLIFMPLLTIWALNTLFPVLAIGYNISTWFAVIIVGGFLRAKVNMSK